MEKRPTGGGAIYSLSGGGGRERGGERKGRKRKKESKARWTSFFPKKKRPNKKGKIHYYNAKERVGRKRGSRAHSLSKRLRPVRERREGEGPSTDKGGLDGSRTGFWEGEETPLKKGGTQLAS